MTSKTLLQSDGSYFNDLYQLKETHVCDGICGDIQWYMQLNIIVIRAVVCSVIGLYSVIYSGIHVVACS